MRRAIKLFHQARGATTDEVEIPDASAFSKRDRGSSQGKGKSKGDRKGPKGNVGPGTGLVYVGLGRKAGIRPGDLVGAIANETDLVGRDIGPIRIADAYSVVGVPEEAVDKVVEAIKATTIRGKKARSRPYVA